MNYFLRGARPMAYLLLHITGKFAESLLETVGNKNRVVAEAIRSLGFKSDIARAYSFAQKFHIAFPVANCHRTDKARASVFAGFVA